MTHHDTARTLAATIDAARSTLDGLSVLAESLHRAMTMIATTLTGGGKLLCCGNGGSAADCAHFTAEIAGRYALERPGYPAIDLTANHALTTALANDYPPEQVFSRQLQALSAEGDVLVAISTTGASPNVRLALETAPALGVGTIALLGRDGGQCKGLADAELIVPGDTTARIQEAHLLLYHSICELLDPVLADAE